MPAESPAQAAKLLFADAELLGLIDTCFSIPSVSFLWSSHLFSSQQEARWLILA